MPQNDDLPSSEAPILHGLCVVEVPCPIRSMGQLYIYLHHYIYHKDNYNIGKYTSPMDCMGVSCLGRNITTFRKLQGVFSAVKHSSFFFPHRRQVQPHTGEKEIARTMKRRHLDGNLDC